VVVRGRSQQLFRLVPPHADCLRLPRLAITGPVAVHTVIVRLFSETMQTTHPRKLLPIRKACNTWLDLAGLASTNPEQSSSLL
jgi:hypothetical protein